MTSEQQVILHVSLIEHIGSTTAHALVQACKKTQVPLYELYRFSAADFMALGITAERAAKIQNGLADDRLLEHERARLEKHQIKIIFCDDQAYPMWLKNTGVPPILLYVRGGHIPAGERSVAIVGSRQATAYGRSFIKTVMPEIAQRSWCVVSGGARGIDAMAHEEALAHTIPTVVVLGSGLLKPYPCEHKKLFDRVAASGGCVVSPFALESDPDAWRFPARNRIIAGLSRGVIVVQAARKSGAHSTAFFALEYGREVFAVPGPFDDPLSAGCHWLLQQGARAVTSAADIWQELDPAGVPPKKIPVLEKTDKQETFLSPRERIVARCREGACIDSLAQELAVPLEQIYQELFTLQVEGIVHQDFSGLYRTRV